MTEKDRSVLGVWKLLSIEYINDDGSVTYPFGTDVAGAIIIDAGGSFSVHLMDMTRPPFKIPDPRGGTSEEVRAAFEGYMGYYGNYDLDENEKRITFHVAGAWLPNWIGGDQTRYYALSGNRMTINTAPVLFEGKEVVAKLVWERSA